MKNMLKLLKQWIDKKLGVTHSDETVSDIKQNAVNKVDEVVKSIKKQGELQKRIIKKTTTYYIGKAVGHIE